MTIVATVVAQPTWAVSNHPSSQRIALGQNYFLSSRVSEHAGCPGAHNDPKVPPGTETRILR